MGSDGIRLAMRQPGLRRYFIGQTISVTGSWMAFVALGWLAFAVTGSPAAVGAVTAARTLPILLLALPAGVLGDRIDRRRIIIATSLLGAAAAGALAVLAGRDDLTIAPLLVLSAAAGVGSAIELPTYNAFLGQLAGRYIVPAIALNGVVFNTARIIGPGLGGVLLVTNGPGAVFAFNAASYLALALILATLDAGTAIVRSLDSGGVRAAVTYVRSDPRLVTILILLAVHTMTMSIPVFLAAPIAVGLGGGALGTGVLIAAAGVGAIISLIGIARWGGRPWRRWLIGAGVLGAAGQVALAAADSMEAGTVAMAVAGAGMVTYTAVSSAVIQVICPEGLRARLMSFYVIVIPGITPLAAIVAGVVASGIGIDATLVVAAAIWIGVLCLATFASAGLRALADGSATSWDRARQV